MITLLVVHKKFFIGIWAEGYGCGSLCSPQVLAVFFYLAAYGEIRLPELKVSLLWYSRGLEAEDTITMRKLYFLCLV